jgi:hypothetical protein
MNIVEYLVRVWHALLTPEDQLPEITGDKIKEYDHMLKKLSERRSDNLINLSRRSWKAIVGCNESLTDNESDPKVSKTALIHMLTPEIMSGLTELGVGGKELKLLIGDDDEWEIGWGGYKIGVEDIVQQVVCSNFKKSEEREVRDMLLKKVEWVLMNHDGVHYQRRIPLLTPGVIVGYADAMKMIPNALTEVSPITLKHDHSMKIFRESINI